MNKTKNLHLITSIILIIGVGLSYGINPSKIIPETLNINIDTINLSNVFRAIMGLYLAMAFYWIIGVKKAEYWKGATVSVVIFMGGLAFGRTLSLVLDGIPHFNMIIGLIVEFIFMAWGIYNLKKYTD